MEFEVGAEFMETYILGGALALFTLVSIIMLLHLALKHFFPRDTK